MNKKELEILLEHGESDWLDWKTDFPPGLVHGRKDSGWEEGKATLLKDMISLANCRGHTPAYLVYGVKDLKTKREVKGITKSFDDADFQQWARAVFDPQPDFHYEEIAVDGSNTVGVIQLEKTQPLPHIVKKDVGKMLHAGQVWFRSGTRNDIALHSDLKKMFQEEKPVQFTNFQDPDLRRIKGLYRSQGRTVTFLLIEEKQLHLAQGYELAVYPSTQQEIVLGTGRPELIAMLEPLSLRG